MLVLLIPHAGYKRYENAQKKKMRNPKWDADRWVKAGVLTVAREIETRNGRACSLQRKYAVLTLLEHETLDKKRGVAVILGHRERMAEGGF